jgi:hypothetical protein
MTRFRFDPAAGILWIALVALAVAPGCATRRVANGGTQMLENLSVVELARVERQRDRAREMKLRGEWCRAADLFEDLAAKYTNFDHSFRRSALAEAAVCHLVCGDEKSVEAFHVAVEGLLITGNESSWSDDELALVLLSDRLAGLEPRAGSGPLSPAVRKLLSSEPLPSWKIGSLLEPQEGGAR